MTLYMKLKPKIELFKEQQAANVSSQSELYCSNCDEIMSTEDHRIQCEKASRYIMDKSCLICDTTYGSSKETFKHIMEWH